jgi:hypothetical protein
LDKAAALADDQGIAHGKVVTHLQITGDCSQKFFSQQTPEVELLRYAALL